MTDYQFFHWSSLRSIGNSPISKASILIPFIGYIILLQSKVTELFLQPLGIINSSFEIRLSISFYLLYFGLFIFGLGSFLFHVACPAAVKKYSTSDEYVERMQSLISTADLRVQLSCIARHYGPTSPITQEASLYKNSIDVGVSDKISASAKIFSLRFNYEVVDKSLFSLRVCVFLLFSLGIILTSIPSFFSLFRVSREFFTAYFQ